MNAAVGLTGIAVLMGVGKGMRTAMDGLRDSMPLEKHIHGEMEVRINERYVMLLNVFYVRL